jgi:hypothetical protein
LEDEAPAKEVNRSIHMWTQHCGAGRGRGLGAQSAKVVKVANWSDANPNRLEPHKPKPTDVVVTLGSKH